MKIDQLKKFLSKFAYQDIKVEKKVELYQLTMSAAKNPSSGVCGRKTSNLCVILFLKGKGQGLIDIYKPLLEVFKNDPVTITYIFSSDEPHIVKQFGIIDSIGAVIYKPKRAKFSKLDRDFSQDAYVDVDTVKSFIDDALGGGGSWKGISSVNDNGLLFKEFMETYHGSDEL